VTGFLVFAGRYAEPGKGDTVKSIYLVYLVPFAGWSGSAAVYTLARALRGKVWVTWTLLLSLLLLPIFVAPNCLYLPPRQTLKRTWEMPAVRCPMDVTFGEAVTLAGYDVEIDSVNAQVAVILVWRVDDYVGAGYKVFVHLMSDDGRLLAQADAVPADWQRPTQGWAPGEYVTDAHLLHLQTADLSQVRQLVLGLYSKMDGHRLTTARGDDHVVIELSAFCEQRSQ
jgi:hypothetical protein